MADDQVQDRMPLSLLGGFLAGSSILLVCSFLQKIAAGFNPFLLKGYTVPFFFGGITGAILNQKCRNIARLNRVLTARNAALEELLPICSHCKSIREPGKDPKDKNAWHPIEDFLLQKTSNTLTHGICPDCIKKNYPEFSTAKGSETDR